jgi:hypothetical protein
MGRTRNPIDQALMDKRRLSHAVDIRSFRGADCNADRYLVVVGVRERETVSK